MYIYIYAYIKLFNIYLQYNHLTVQNSIFILVPIKIQDYLKIISFKTYITVLCQRERETDGN